METSDGLKQKKMDVVIIGGSLAGLFHGILLKSHGHTVRILERSPSSIRANQAAGIGIGPEGRRFLEKFDPDRSTVALDSPGMQFVDFESSVIGRHDNPLYLTTWDMLYYRLRGLFDAFASELCKSPPAPPPSHGETSFEVGANVTGVRDSGERVCVDYDKPVDGQAVEHRTHTADLVVDASGAQSTIRKALLPDVEDVYSGYVAWRGTAPEDAVSHATRELFKERLNIYAMPHTYIVGYAVPGPSGELHAPLRTLNYVWYAPLPRNSPAFAATMTDTSSIQHRTTLPRGALSPAVWSAHKAHHRPVMNPAFLDLIDHTSHPFISTLRDLHAGRAVFMRGRLLLVGDAVNLLRPHTGMSTNQAAMHCLLLERVLSGEMGLQEWESAVLERGKEMAKNSRAVAESFLRREEGGDGGGEGASPFDGRI